MVKELYGSCVLTRRALLIGAEQVRTRMELWATTIRTGMARWAEGFSTRIPPERCEQILANGHPQSAAALARYSSVPGRGYVTSPAVRPSSPLFIHQRLIPRISMVGGEILAIGYGIEVQAKDDPYVAMAEHAEGAVKAALNPGSYLVDLLPFRESYHLSIGRHSHTDDRLATVKYVPEWVPGAGFQREARLWRKSAIASRDMPYDFVKHRMVHSIVSGS